MNITITPKAIETKAGTKGQYLRVKDERGNWYSVWEQDLFHFFIEDQPVSVATTTQTKNGKTFTNITDVLDATVPVQRVSIQEPRPAANPNNPDDDRHKEIARGQSFNLANARINALIIAGGQPSEEYEDELQERYYAKLTGQVPF